MHGQLVVIVYTSMCTSIALLTFQINIELNHKRVCMAETVDNTVSAMHDVQLTLVMKFKHMIIN